MLLRHIRYFLAVAEHGNFTRAAEALHVSQPTLSLQIRQLEESLRAQLLDRSGRTVRLTDAGAAYRAYAQRALQDLEAGKRALHDVQDLSRGELRLAITPTFTPYLVGPLVAAFNEQYPEISLGILEMPQERIEAMLADDALDIGIAFDEISHPDIESQPLLVETLAMVVGPLHPLASKHSALSLKQFERERFILLNEQFATRLYINRYCRQHGVVPHIAMESNSVSAVIEIVRRTNMATLLPSAVAGTQEGLFQVRLEPAPSNRVAALLQRKDAYRSAASRAFVEMASKLKT
ncbi:DNA-binding transcriptional dual regulator (plasmid) [Cupriavidus taiwanensis]|uniref:DNA-binding transcriptional dual regulator n=1 Tax=Cupriavidus taiwanensis TaxID=164546 RepID=A0A375IPK8_9BURK|nr:transcriptional regulator CynR [Cupriavidus taiwanensis]SPK76000.1 DNA-binding transcriptional dual regulator [Cupriavidus taiwanensis]